MSHKDETLGFSKVAQTGKFGDLIGTPDFKVLTTGQVTHSISSGIGGGKAYIDIPFTCPDGYQAIMAVPASSDWFVNVSLMGFNQTSVTVRMDNTGTTGTYDAKAFAYVLLKKIL